MNSLRKVITKISKQTRETKRLLTQLLVTMTIGLITVSAFASPCQRKEAKNPIDAIRYFVDPELTKDSSCEQEHLIAEEYRISDQKYHEGQNADKSFREKSSQDAGSSIELDFRALAPKRYLTIGGTKPPRIATATGYKTIDGGN